MGEWKEYELGKAPLRIIDGDRGNNYPKKHEFSDNGYCLFLNTKNVTSSGFSFSELNFITEAKDQILRKGKLERSDLVLTTRGTIGNVGFYDDSVKFDNLRINSGMVVIRPDGIDPRFNYQLFKYLKKDFETFTTGSAQPQLPIRDLEKMVVLLPPLPEQRAIASVLSSLDDKIDLLHRQNKTLESMAETLFRQWFIEGAKEEWEEKPLSFYGDIICGKTPSTKVASYFGGNVPFIKIPDMHGKVFLIDTANSLTEEGKLSQANKTLPAKAICVSCIATVGLVSMNVLESQTNQQINSIIPKKDHYRYFLYLTMKDSTDLIHAMASGGTATLNLNTGDFSQIPIVNPGDELLLMFHGQVKSLFEKILFNQIQIRDLGKLRDTLLPKLMSGEVRVEQKC
jgi:type I restriction enzyme S subunit